MSERTRIEVMREVVAGTVDMRAASTELGVSEAQIAEWADLVLLSRESVAPRARRSAPRMKRALVAVATSLALVLSLVTGAGVFAQTVCGGESQLPSPFRTFCPQARASAADVNHNFRTLATLLESRTGTINPGNLTDARVTTQNVTAQSVSAQNVSTSGAAISGAIGFGNVTRQMINLWGTEYGIGVQNSTMYSRSGAHFAWYRGGVHGEGVLDAGGGVRTMGLDSNGNLQTAGGVFAQGFYGPLGRSACDWVGTGGGSDTGPNWTRHTAVCPYGRYAAGWSCYASDYIDGGCQLYCCTP